VLAGNLGPQMTSTHHFGQAAHSLEEGPALAASDVEDEPCRARGFERHAARAGYVSNADEVALLMSVFEDERTTIAEEARREARQHSRVRIGDCLTSA